MPVDPQESPKARAETGQKNLAAASNLTQPISPAGCAPRGPHPLAGRSAAGGQSFDFRNELPRATKQPRKPKRSDDRVDVVLFWLCMLSVVFAFWAVVLRWALS